MLTYILYLVIAAILMPTIVSLVWVKRIIKEVGWKPYLIYCVYSMSAIIMVILTYILSPFLSLYSVIFNKKNLPMPFYLFQTHDNDLDGGQDQGYKITTNKFRLWWQRMCWLCRNPAYAYSAYIIGLDIDDYELVRTDDSFIDDKSDARLTFTIFNHVSKDKKRFGIRWHPIWSDSFYVKYWIGWNHASYDGLHYQVKTMCNPFKKRNKRGLYD